MSAALLDVKDCTVKFGGLTAFSRSPAEGVDTGQGRERHDDLIVFEVMTDEIDGAWWTSYREMLEKTFRQDRILIRSSQVDLL